MSISIGTPMPPRHAQSARNAPHFGIRLSLPSSGWNDSDDAHTCRWPLPSRLARVSPRSHCFGTRQPRTQATAPFSGACPTPALSAPCWTRGRRFACQARMQPRSAALRDTKWPLSGRRVGASATGNPGFMPSHCHACIDLQATFVIHYRFPRANLGPLHRGAKGVAVVTCPSSPGPEPGWPSPPRRPPRGSLS